MENLELNNIIQKYDKIIKNFHDKAYNDVFPKLDIDRAKYDFILEKLHSLYFISNYISTNCGIQTSNVNENALLTIYNIISSNLLAIFHCLYNGLEIQAGIISRSLFESYINCKFILKEDVQERLRLFYNFQFIERYIHIKYNIDKNPNYLVDMNVDSNIYAEYKKEYDSLIVDYNPKFPYHWAYKSFKEKLKRKNPNLRTICSDLGEKYIYDYDVLYNISSMQVHPSSIMGNYFTIRRENENISINSPKFTDGIVTLSANVLTYCGNIILDILNYFHPKNEGDISIYLKHYVEVSIIEAHSYLFKKKMV